MGQQKRIKNGTNKNNQKPVKTCLFSTKVWNTIASILSTIDHTRRPNDMKTDTLGNMHVILFGDTCKLNCSHNNIVVLLCDCVYVQVI